MKTYLLLLHLLIFTVLSAQDQKKVTFQVDGRVVTPYVRSAALLVGMSEYNTDWPKLPGVLDEIGKVKELLQNQGFYVETLLNPTEDKLEDKFHEFISRNCTDPATRFIFYYAGHGRTVKTIYGDELGYLVPVNAPDPNNDLAKFLSTSIEMEVIEGYAREVSSKHALFLFDAAFSNPIFSATPVTPRLLNSQSLLSSRQFITSASGSDQLVKPGKFSETLRQALDGKGDKNSDGLITGTELAEFLQMNILASSGYSMHPQYGEIRDPELNKGDFIFLAGKPPAADPPVKAKPEPVVVSPPVAEKKEPLETREAEKTVPRHQDPVNDFGIEMVFVEGGEFLMGNPRGRGAEVPVHKVKVDNFYISSREITQKQYRDIAGMNPSRFKGCDDCPVEMVSYMEAIAFTAKLRQKSGRTYRLPTEAEWEYAARGGRKSRNQKFSGAESPDLVAWYLGNSSKRSHPVGKKAANELGIYDMSGNIYEWCLDWFDEAYYRKSPFDNPHGSSNGETRVVRGGSWKLDGTRLTVTFRYGIRPSAKYDDVGFRVVLEE